MSKVNVTLKESAIQYGLILGGILAILIVMMYALNQDLFLEWWIGIVVIPLIIIGTGIVSTAKSKDLLGGIMTFKEAFTAYFITIALGLLISTAVITAAVAASSAGVASESHHHHGERLNNDLIDAALDCIKKGDPKSDRFGRKGR